MTALWIGLGVLWAALLWLVLFGVPWVVTAATAVAFFSLLVAGKAGPLWAVIALLGLAALADLAGRYLDRLFVRSQGPQALAMGGGLVLLGLVLGPVLGSATWGVTAGDTGRVLLSEGKRLAYLLMIGRLIRGGVALGIGFALFFLYAR